MNIDARSYAADEVLRDGGSIHIRAIRADDRARLLKHFARLSARSVYFRFFGVKRELKEEEVRRFIEPDFKRHVALVAVAREAGEESIIGVGRYFVSEEARERAELGFAILDEYQGRGIGTLLLEHLARIARANGIREFEANVLGENNRMLEVFASSGFRARRSVDAGVFHISFPTEETEQFQQRSLARERAAAAQSVRALLNPRAVAVVGASRKPRTIGFGLLANLQRSGFTGAIYPVNPHASELGGLRCYPSVRAIGQPVDLAVIAVPVRDVETVVADCGDAGVRGIVLITSGYAEVSEDGRAAERRLVELVRTSGMRMIGPNCMGILNTDPAVALNATFAGQWPPPGNVGMLSQSGALGIAILDYVHKLNIGLSSFLSVGNKADVSSNDLLCYYAEDPRTDVIVLYLESFGNPRKFARLAPEVALRKPIVAVKSGRSAAGTRAASSHSAALASLDIAADALFEQAGVIRTDTLEQLFDLIALLATQPIPSGPAVGVVTNAGGPGILLADACEARGLKLPELKPTTLETLRTFLAPLASLSNPIDMSASASADDYRRTIEAVGKDPNVDSVVVLYTPPMLTLPEEIASAIAAGAGVVPAQKPVMTVFLSSKGPPKALNEGPRGKLPSYSFPENAALALAAAQRHGCWLRRPRSKPVTLDRFAQSAIRAVVERVLSAGPGRYWVGPEDLTSMLGAAGIECAMAVQTPIEEAVATAERYGYPLVAKIVSSEVIHKTEVGGVIMGLRSARDVAAAVETLVERMRSRSLPLQGILLQREIPGAVEALVGVTSDPTFGPLLVCCLGGVLAEVFKDAAFRLAPVTEVDAAEMVASLRSKRLLEGFRGAPPADQQALIRLITRLSALVELVPEIRELDLNPVKLLSPGEGAIVVDGRMRIAS